MIHGYAEFVQLLPATESGHYAEPGGLLKHGLETAGFAPDAGRGRTLPPDTGPAATGQQAARRTCAVLIAALLNDIAPALDRMRSTIRQSGGQAKLWSPREGSMVDAGAISYRVEFVDGGGPGRNRSGFGALLVERLVPGATLAWLSADAKLMRELVALLSSDSETAHSRLAEVVRQAAAESVRRNLLTGSRVRLAAARGVPLIERLMSALRAIVPDRTRIPFSGPDAAGWVQDSDAWLDADRLLDAMQRQLQADALGDTAISADDKIVQTWAAYGTLMPNPQSGAARWNALVGDGDDGQVRTLLRFSLNLLFSEPLAWPARRDGTFDPDAQDSDRQGRPTAAAEPQGTGTGGDTGSERNSPPAHPTATWAARLDPPRRPPVTDSAIRFMSWLVESLREGKLRINDSAGPLHFVPEGLLLVSPRIFREYATTLARERANAGAEAIDEADLVKATQRQLVRQDWHLQETGGNNMIAYLLAEGGRPRGRLSGIVIRNPQAFGIPAHPPNPALVRRPAAGRT
jgi:hypothetical protein